jgi:hypothetical protein
MLPRCDFVYATETASCGDQNHCTNVPPGEPQGYPSRPACNSSRDSK